MEIMVEEDADFISADGNVEEDLTDIIAQMMWDYDDIEVLEVDIR